MRSSENLDRTGLSRAGWYKKSKAKDQTALRMRIREIAMNRLRENDVEPYGRKLARRAFATS